MKNWSRLKSSRSYYEVQDSYRIPRLLQRARHNYEPYGLPLSVSVRQIYSRFKRGSDSLNGGSNHSLRRIRLSSSPSAPNLSFNRRHRNFKAWKFRSRVKGFCQATVKPRSRWNLKKSRSFEVESSNDCTAEISGALIEEPWDESDVDLDLPAFKSYKIQSCDGKQFHVVEIDIPYKKEKFETAILNRTSMRFQRAKQFLSRYLKAVIFSEKGASMLWLFDARVRIILMSNDEPNASQWFNKIKNDVSLIKSKVNDETNKWHPVVQWRLNQALESCRELIQPKNQSEATVTNLIPNCQPANEAILRAAKFVWNSLGTKSASSLHPPTQRLTPSPVSSGSDKTWDFECSYPEPSLEIGAVLDGYIRSNGTSASTEPTGNSQKSIMLKLLDELNKKLGMVPSKLRKMSQVVPWSIKGTYQGDIEEVPHGSATSFSPTFFSPSLSSKLQDVN